MQTPLSRRVFLSALSTLTTGVLAAACAPQLPQESKPGPALPPAPAGQARPVVEVPAPAPIVPTPLPPTATAVPATATARPPSPTATTPPPTATPVAPTETPSPSPTPLAYDAARLKDKLGSAQTSYVGSIPERAWNVELAAKRLNGTKVAPGEVFSFNEAVGPTTLAAGFRIGYGITMSNDRPQTIPSVAGGICQVATTVFQAAYWAGLRFVERHYHLYWIPRYGQPPSGKTGFDATVDDPGVDLKFTNTTDDWIRLDSWVDGENIGFVIYGVDPGWKIETLGPKVYDVVKTSQTPVRQEDYTMPPGRELWVEHAEDGFRVSVTRLVKLNGQVVDEYAFTNHYLPSRNVLLVGAVPRARTSPTEGSPVPTPPEATPAAPVADTPPANQPATAPLPQPAAPPPPQPPRGGPPPLGVGSLRPITRP